MSGTFYLLSGCQWKSLPRFYGAPSTVHDRGKNGTKRSIVTDGKGIPLSVTVDGANRHDKKLVKKALDAIVIDRPSHKVIQNICMDRGYDFPDIRELVDDYGYTAHIENVEKET